MAGMSSSEVENLSRTPGAQGSKPVLKGKEVTNADKKVGWHGMGNL